MSYYRFGELQVDFRMPSGYDRTRGAEIGRKNFDLTHVREEFTSEHWLVRIYKVKSLDNHLKVFVRVNNVLVFQLFNVSYCFSPDYSATQDESNSKLVCVLR